MISITECSLRRDMIPASLYAGRPYHVTGIGLEMSLEIKREVERFIREFVDYFYFHKHPVFRGHPPYHYSTGGNHMRLDLFVDPSLKSVHLLEVNSRFVDGWGSSLNLARAVEDRASNVDRETISFSLPLRWYLPGNNEAYRAEFNLALQEMKMAGASKASLREMRTEDFAEHEGIFMYRGNNPHGVTPVYYYGWDRPKTEGMYWEPLNGYALEDKALLVEFSSNWKSAVMEIPRCYGWPMPWEEIPKERVIWKFCEKYGEDSKRARTSVLYPEEAGRGKFIRQCYQRGTVIAQELAPTLHTGDRMCQLILLVGSGRVATGYALWAPRGTRVITDACTHGPLIWSE